MSKTLIITSSDLRPGCRDLAVAMRLDPTLKQPTTLPMRMGLFRHDVRRQCHRVGAWPPAPEAMERICKDVWLLEYTDLMEDEYRAARDQMLASIRLADLWPPLASVLAVEDWMSGVPASNIVQHRGQPGWDALIGLLDDGTEVHLRSRFDLAYLDESNVSRGELVDTKGAGGDYEYQADHNALGASLLWDGIPEWRYRAVYLGSYRRPQEFEYDAERLRKVRARLMKEAAQIHAEMGDGRADATPGERCDWCPKAGACAAHQRALLPLATTPPARKFPAPAELKTLPSAELLDVYQRFELPASMVANYDKALTGAVKARLKESAAPLVGSDGAGVRLALESGGDECADTGALVSLIAKHGLRLEECVNPVWGEIKKGLAKYTAEADRLAALAEFDALKVPKKQREVIRPVKAKEAA